MIKPFLLFDFDGVIADSFDLAKSVTSELHPHLTETEYRALFEGHINDSASLMRCTNACRGDNFFDIYVPRMEKEIRPFPGMFEVLLKLERLCSLVIVTSTISAPVQAYLDRNGLTSHFQEVMGNDVHKSKVEKIKMVFEKYNITADDCLFITDTLGDMREATKAGVKSIGVTWGFHTPETLSKGSPIKLVYTPEELLKTIENEWITR